MFVFFTTQVTSVFTFSKVLVCAFRLVCLIAWLCHWCHICILFPKNTIANQYFIILESKRLGLMLTPRDINEKKGRAVIQLWRDSRRQFFAELPSMDFCHYGGLNMAMPVITWLLWGWLNGHIISAVIVRWWCYMHWWNWHWHSMLSYLLSTSSFSKTCRPESWLNQVHVVFSV